VARLLKLVADGVSSEAIGVELGRSRAAIRARARSAGVRLNESEDFEEHATLEEAAERAARLSRLPKGGVAEALERLVEKTAERASGHPRFYSGESEGGVAVAGIRFKVEGEPGWEEVGVSFGSPSDSWYARRGAAPDAEELERRRLARAEARRFRRAGRGGDDR